MWEKRKHIQTACPFVFLSQREHRSTTRLGDHPRRLTEGGLHAWWRTVKERATRQQWEHIADITFHDLRHDFGHRLRAAGFSLEEVAVMFSQGSSSYFREGWKTGRRERRLSDV